jgi:recombination protein RecT
MTTATKEAPKQATRKNELAVLKDQTVGAVEKRIAQLTANHQLTLPENYSVGNALQAAWLNLQEVKDKNKKPALQVCSRNSVVQALFSMVVQALDPGKKQGYFIVYGQSLVFQRSYFGTEAVAKRMADVKEIFTEVIYEGDVFEYEIERGRTIVTKHRQSFDNVDVDKIKGAYAVIVFNNETRGEHTEIMTIDQIKKAWSKSRGNPNSDSSPHQEFPDQMAKKTVLSRALKRHINSSSDDHLFVREFNRSDNEAAVAEIDAEASEYANGELLEANPVHERTIDMETYEEPGDESAGDDAGLFPPGVPDGDEDGPGY